MLLYKFSSSAWGFWAVLQCKYKQVLVVTAVYEVLYEQVYAMLLKKKQGMLVHVHAVDTLHPLKRNLPPVLNLAALLSFFWGSSVGSVCRDVRRIWEEKHRGGGVRDRTQMICVLRETWQVCILTSSKCKLAKNIWLHKWVILEKESLWRVCSFPFSEGLEHIV